MDKLMIRLAKWPAYHVNNKVKTRTQLYQRCPMLSPQHYHHIIFATTASPKTRNWFPRMMEILWRRGHRKRSAILQSHHAFFFAPAFLSSSPHPPGHPSWPMDLCWRVPYFECCFFFTTPTFLLYQILWKAPRSLPQSPRFRTLFPGLSCSLAPSWV